MAARRHVQSQMAITSWSEADAALRQIAECENLLAEQTIEMNRQLDQIKSASALVSKPVQNRIKNLEQQIKDFADANRLDLAGKSKVLNFGKLGYRLSSSIAIKKEQEPKVIALLRSMKLFDCITVKESVNKDSLKSKGVEVISGVGAVLSQKDEFWYETAKEQLHEAEQ